MTVAIGPGSTFAGYRIESLIGRGGMGVVYKATDLSLDRPVALKLIAPELAEDERFRERFLNEPRLAASLDHPNVVPIYEAGEHDGQLYLAMRYAVSFFLGFFASGQAAGYGSFLAELFPTSIRGAGQGLAYNLGRGLARSVPASSASRPRRSGSARRS